MTEEGGEEGKKSCRFDMRPAHDNPFAKLKISPQVGTKHHPNTSSTVHQPHACITRWVHVSSPSPQPSHHAGAASSIAPRCAHCNSAQPLLHRSQPDSEQPQAQARRYCMRCFGSVGLHTLRDCTAAGIRHHASRLCVKTHHHHHHV